VTHADRRLRALAALFAAERAIGLLARAGEPRSREALDDVARLASGPRRERLAALASAVSVDPASVRASATAAAALERPRVAALLRELAAGGSALRAPDPLLRLCRERLGR
jgi:hypothetical protein